MPQVRTQAPGYYRMMLGDYEVTTVSDGTVPQDFDKVMTNTTPEEVRALFARSREPLPVDVSINTFLINTGSKPVLVDTGAGDLFGPKAGGRLVANPKASGSMARMISSTAIPGQLPSVPREHVRNSRMPQDGGVELPSIQLRRGHNTS